MKYISLYFKLLFFFLFSSLFSVRSIFWLSISITTIARATHLRHLIWSRCNAPGAFVGRFSCPLMHPQFLRRCLIWRCSVHFAGSSIVYVCSRACSTHPIMYLCSQVNWQFFAFAIADIYLLFFVLHLYSPDFHVNNCLYIGVGAMVFSSARRLKDVSVDPYFPVSGFFCEYCTCLGFWRSVPTRINGTNGSVRYVRFSSVHDNMVSAWKKMMALEWS